jgi:hypothetical protein
LVGERGDAEVSGGILATLCFAGLAISLILFALALLAAIAWGDWRWNGRE